VSRRPPRTAEQQVARATTVVTVLVCGGGLAAGGLTWVLTSSPGKALAAALAAVVLVVGTDDVVVRLRLWVRARRLRARPTGRVVERADLPDEVAAVVDRAEAIGFRWAGARRNAREVTALLVDADGAVLSAAVVHGRLATAVSTCLVPGERWLLTMSAPDSWVGPAFLVDPFQPSTAPSEAVVAQHRATRTGLAHLGVHLVPVGADEAQADGEALLARVADDRRVQAVRVRARGSRPLLEHPRLPEAIAGIRARQAELGIGAASG
jgi:hypothetical protein